MPEDESAMVALARRFTAAICARDVEALRSLYTSDMTAWKITDKAPRTVEEHLATYPTSTAFMKHMEYIDVRVTPFDGGFVQQHTLVATLENGGTLSFAVCLVARVRDGLIARLEEYFDSGVFTSLGLQRNKTPEEPAA